MSDLRQNEEGRQSRRAERSRSGKRTAQEIQVELRRLEIEPPTIAPGAGPAKAARASPVVEVLLAE
jgi:hypothetical protein